jgi:hypothetical protein
MCFPKTLHPGLDVQFFIFQRRQQYLEREKLDAATNTVLARIRYEDFRTEADRLCVLARETQLELWAEVLKPTPSPARLDAIAAQARSSMNACATWYEEQLKFAQNSVVVLRRFAKFELEVGGFTVAGL